MGTKDRRTSSKIILLSTIDQTLQRDKEHFSLYTFCKRVKTYDLSFPLECRYDDKSSTVEEYRNLQNSNNNLFMKEKSVNSKRDGFSLSLDRHTGTRPNLRDSLLKE